MTSTVPRESIPVRNPRTGAHDDAIVPPSKDELWALAQRLRSAQKRWSDAGIDHRVAVLRRWAAAIDRSREAIGAAEAIDTARNALSRQQPNLVMAGIEGWCERAPAIMRDAHLAGQSTIMPHVHFETQLRPYPLLGVISPWNHPFMLSTIDAIPALLAGCAAIIKPSEITPRFIAPVMETIDGIEDLRDVLAFIPGDGQTGRDLIEMVDAICFTGSIATGRSVAEACARRFIPAFLELGGKDAAIVTASADVVMAATAVVRGSNDCTGQLCFATERVYVADAIHDAFVDELVRQCNAIELTYPDPDRGDLGPFILEKQAQIVDAHIDDALARGAVMRAGGKSERLGGGLFMRPTVLTNVSHDMAIMREETFGPVTPVMRYATEEEALALANDSYYGLSGAVIAGSEDEALRIGRQLDAGAITLQDTALTVAILRDAEKTAFRSSGMGGSRMGSNSLMRFFRKKVLITNERAPLDMRSGVGA